MRQHICKECGRIYLTDKPDSTVCPACYTVTKSNILRRKQCAMCGNEFLGYPRSKYCNVCRITAQREAGKRYKKAGAARPIGSTDICLNCGKQYTVNSGRQRYCPDCAKNVVPDNIRKNKREYVRQNADKINAHKAERRKGRRVCAICGNPFYSLKPTVVCSPACANEYKRRKQVMTDVRREKALPQRIFSKADRQNPQSGIPGITWHKKTNKWQVKYQGKYVGLRESLEDAQKLLKEAKNND